MALPAPAAARDRSARQKHQSDPVSSNYLVRPNKDQTVVRNLQECGLLPPSPPPTYALPNPPTRKAVPDAEKIVQQVDSRHPALLKTPETEHAASSKDEVTAPPKSFAKASYQDDMIERQDGDEYESRWVLNEDMNRADRYVRKPVIQEKSLDGMNGGENSGPAKKPKRSRSLFWRWKS